MRGFSPDSYAALSAANKDHLPVDEHDPAPRGNASTRTLAHAEELRQASVRRRRRALVAVSLVSLAGLIAGLGSCGGGSSPGSRTRILIERQLAVSRVGTLPAAVQDAAAAGLGGERVAMLGGIDAAAGSTGAITLLDGANSTSGGLLPAPQHDAQAASIAGAVYVFGGGVVTSFDHILRYDPASARVTGVGTLPRAASDVAVSAIADTAYVVGGYDGSRPLDTIVAWRPGTPARVVAHLPLALRYAAVAAVGGRLIIAGGTDPGGTSDAVFSYVPATGVVREIGQLRTPLTHASAAALDGLVYIIGGRRSVTGAPTAAILSIDPASGAVHRAGHLPQPLSDAAVVGTGDRIIVAGGETAGVPQSAILSVAATSRRVVEQLGPAGRRAMAIDPALYARGFGSVLQASPASIPIYNAAALRTGLPGYLLIADRGNNRVLVVNPTGHIAWHYPTATDLAAHRRLLFNDDTFVVPGGQALIANEEDRNAIVSIAIGSHNLHVLFGHPGVVGGDLHHLNYPDDAYALPDGSFSVSDAYNCRILFVRAGQVLRQYGHSGVCRHDPPAYFGPVNGDTPTPDGGMLVSEINGHWIDSIAADGSLRFAVRAPVSFPSDAQPLPGDQILVADYSNPGQIVVTDRFAHVLWRYGPASGAGRLDHPSLAIELPNGDIAVNDDYRDRVVIIDPRTNQIVWQYGHTDQPGTAPGYLNTPDGMDFIPADPGGQPAWAAVVRP